MFKVVALES